jgi:hypothetical protein
MNFFGVLFSFGWFLVACGYSIPLKRPIITSDKGSVMASYYTAIGPITGSLPLTQKDCEQYLKKPLVGVSDSLVAAVCYLNLGKYDSAQILGQTQNSCFRQVLQYDIEIEKGLSGVDRFTQLQTLLECSKEPHYTRMIQARGKLAHYE